jgi:hypothetical protein
MLLQLKHSKRKSNGAEACTKRILHLPVKQRIVEKLLHRVQLFIDLRTVLSRAAARSNTFNSRSRRVAV